MPSPLRTPQRAAPPKQCAVTDCPRDYRAVGHCAVHLPHATELYRARQTEDTVCGGVWIEDLEFLLAHGCTWEQVCDRVERTPGALEMGLKRAGRPDLTARLKLASDRVLVGAA